MKSYFTRIRYIVTCALASLLIIAFLASCSSSSSGTQGSGSSGSTGSSGGDGLNYYISPSGNDSNPGSISSPWQTLKKAADTLTAGQTVYIMQGTYNERVLPVNSGTSENYISYVANPGDTVTIDGTGVDVPSDEGLFDMSGRSYIRISGLRVQNSQYAGIYANHTDHIIIEKNYTNNTVSSGIGVWNSNNVTVDNNEVVLACNGGAQECITVATTETFEVKNNTVHDGGTGAPEGGGEGICIKDGSVNGKVFKNNVFSLPLKPGIYLDAWDKHTYNIEVYQNIAHDMQSNTSGSGFALASETGGLLENVKIYNNIAYANTLYGYDFSRNGTSQAHPMRNIILINNTAYDNGRDPWGGSIDVDNPDAESIVIRNNICSQGLTFQIVVSPDVNQANLTVDHNLIDGFRGHADEIRGNNYVEGSPVFANAAQADFHLQASSPAIDAGSSQEAPTTDYDGKARPGGAGVDIGAFEY